MPEKRRAPYLNRDTSTIPFLFHEFVNKVLNCCLQSLLIQAASCLDGENAVAPPSVSNKNILSIFSSGNLSSKARWLFLENIIC